MGSAAASVGWLLVIIGFAIILWGAFAVGISGGIPPFDKLSLLDIPTLMGPVSINDRQYAGGALLVVLGLVIVTFGVGLLKQGKHGGL